MEHRKEIDLLYLEKGVKEYARVKRQEEIPYFKHKEASKYVASSGDGKFLRMITGKDVGGEVITNEAGEKGLRSDHG